MSVLRNDSALSAVDVQVSYKNLSERVLKLTVYDIDRLRRHNVIGSVVFPLRGHEDDVTGLKLFTSLRLEHADAVVDAVSSPAAVAGVITYLNTIRIVLSRPIYMLSESI